MLMFSIKIRLIAMIFSKMSLVIGKQSFLICAKNNNISAKKILMQKLEKTWVKRL